MTAKNIIFPGISPIHRYRVGLALALSFSISSIATAVELQPISESHGPWQVRCLESNDKGAPERCEATLQVTNRGAQIAELAFGRIEGAEQLIVAGRAPLGVLLSDGMRLGSEIDSDPIRASYSSCLPTGCVAQTTIEKARLSDLLSEDGAHLSFREQSGRTVKILIPLQGLKEALGRMGVEMAG